MPESLVRAEDLTRVYGSGRGAVAAIVGASFSIEPGEGVALVGPSGSGKSTLLHLIAGLDRATGGTIVWPALGERESLRPGPVTLAFQGPSLLPPLTVLENVALPLLLAGVPRDQAESAAGEMLSRLEVDHLEDKLPEEISGGQSQRVGLARALAGEPRLVLTDEPTGQQDHAGGQRVMDALIEIVGASGAALVIATHDPSIAARVSRRWAIDDGHLRIEVSPRSA